MRYKLTIIGSTICVVSLAAALASPGGAATAIDGDTFKLGAEHIRIENIDAPEIGHAQCDAELRLGVLAKAKLQEILDSGRLTIQRHRTDVYGRTIAMVSRNRDVGSLMIEAGLARPWTGKREPWCVPLN